MDRRPDPEPLEIDDVRLTAAGTALWALALVVLLVLKATGTEVHGWWLGMCGYGVLLGAWGVRTCARRKARLSA